MVIMRLFFIILILCLTSVASSESQVIINEVLAYQPESDRNLEWFEVHNNTSQPIHMGSYLIQAGSVGNTVSFYQTDVLSPNEYIVYCRNTVRFEEHFGDSSGIWGDNSFENYQLVRSSVTFQLLDSAGSVRIVNPVSEISWSEKGINGYSWERVESDQNTILQSVDRSGSTPGRVNSVTPLPSDLGIDSVSTHLSDGHTIVKFSLTNWSFTPIDDANLFLSYFDPTTDDSIGTTIAVESIGSIDTGATLLLISSYDFSPNYNHLIVWLDNDDRIENNKFPFIAPGESFPPVILSEFLANPTGFNTSEWVELKNIHDTTINLAGWKLGDASSINELPFSSILVFPNEYIIITNDTASFKIEYPNYMGDIIEPESWAILNNTVDNVRLYDIYDIMADSFSYQSVYADNHTWARGETAGRQDDWGRSIDPGGTPGLYNEVQFSADGATELHFSIIPQIFSPNDDNYQDNTVIAISPPEADAYTIKIYDANGRLVKTIEDEAEYLSENYIWNGRDNGGNRLPIGIYIVYFEAVGVQSIKKSVVLAR